MTPVEQELEQTKLILEQEKGKRIAVERENYEVKRQAKITQEQADALRAETDASLLQAAKQMEISMAISQGIYGLARMGRTFIARKVAAARVVHREQQMCLLMQQVIDGLAQGNSEVIKVATDKMKSVIDTIRKDGEMSRMQAAESALAYGLERFEETFDKLVADNNDLVKT